MTQEDNTAGMPRRAWLMGILAGAAALGTGAWFSSRRGLPIESARAADAAPGPLPSPIQTLDGRTLTNADLAGRAVLLNFWAPWCPPCIKEMPELDQFARSPAARDALVIGLAIDERPAVEQWVRAHPVGFPISVLGYGGLTWVRQLGQKSDSALPFSIVFDRQHRVLERKFGPTSTAELGAWAAKF
ncbi:MAG TPA: TlpA disulfide reductase family protein [Burkholderiaceae bacterium]|jgi:thiol-disulfide isomerase/thioredoxin|nr:TlpA disulfide reductase family protein [Burkholderiaceae bacterium]